MDFLYFSVLVVIFLFSFGIFGVLVARKNLMLVFMSIELMLMSVVLGFGFLSVLHGDVFFQVMILVLLVLGGVEAAVALAILVVYYRLSGDLGLEVLTLCKG